MKKLYVLFSFVLLASILIISCDDSGIVNPRNDVTFSATNLKRLNQDTEGMYEAFVSFPSSADHGDASYKSIGKFNMSLDGMKVLDSAGNEIKLRFKDSVKNLNAAQDVIITIEPPYDYDSIPSTRLMGGVATVVDDKLSANLSMAYSEVLGSIADDFINNNAKLMLNTPSTQADDDFYKGVWFCDTVQSGWLTVPIMPDSTGWEYEAWIFDAANTTYYTIGKFKHAAYPDRDGDGPYANEPPFFVYQKVGSDFVTMIPELDLRSSTITIFVTLEPNTDPSLSTPFPIRLLEISNLGNVYKGELKSMTNVMGLNIPSATIIISKF